jgi:hypothetical protein
MRRKLSLVAVLAITGLSACSARQLGGTALIAGITNRPAAAGRTPVADSVEHATRKANGTVPVDLPRAARTAHKLPRRERGAAVAGTSGRIDANTSAEIAPVSASAEPVSGSSIEKPLVETPLRQSHDSPARSFLRPLGIMLLIVAAIVMTRRLF